MERQTAHAPQPAPQPIKPVAPRPVHPLARMQQALGNQAVGRLIQAKLNINQPGDEYEQEADRVADTVMRMPAPQSDGHRLAITPLTSSQAQRKCAECEAEDEGALQRKESGSAVTAPATAPPIVDQALSSQGQPLDAETRAYFELRFGHDFSGVRVHTGQAASASARAINAMAYTVGRDIVFRDGAFPLGSPAGNRLLAHELTHVIQQGFSGTKDGGTPQMRAADLTVSDPGDPAEREADAVAETVASGQAAALPSGPQTGSPKVTGVVSRQGADDLTAYGEGWDWLTGRHPAVRIFDGDDHMTAELRQHSRIVELRAEIVHHACEKCAEGPHSGYLKGADFNYSLAGWTGPFLYARDYIGVPLLYPVFGSAFGANPTVSFLGSFSGNWSANYECGRGITADFTVTNSTNLTSGTRFPVLGYQKVNTPTGPQARPSVEDYLTGPAATYQRMGGVTVPGGIMDDPVPVGSPMGSVSQRFEWSEELPMACPTGPMTPAPVSVARSTASTLESSTVNDGLSATPATAPQAQRKCAGCEEEEGEVKLQRKESDGDGGAGNVVERQEPPHISRNPKPTLNRWALEGTTAAAEEDGEDLGKLARMVGADGGDRVCIRPVNVPLSKAPDKPPDFEENYEKYIRAGDTFDVANLVSSTGPNIAIDLLTSGPENKALKGIGHTFYPRLTDSDVPDAAFEVEADNGITPIRELVLFGHSGGAVMFGGENANEFDPAEFDDKQSPSYTSAEAGQLPRRCWFTPDAQVRAVGCHSAEFGLQFARTYLRSEAEVAVTTENVRPPCETGSYNAATEECNFRPGLEFATTWKTEPPEQAAASRRSDPFWSAAEFHNGPYWATVARRGILGWQVVARGAESVPPRPAAALLGERGEEQIAAIRDLLGMGVKEQEVTNVLVILRSWNDPKVIADSWQLIGEHLLIRFLNNLQLNHFDTYTLEIMASVGALDNEARDRLIRQLTLGPLEITTRAEAALAMFLIMDLQIGPETDNEEAKSEMGALLGVGKTERSQARGQRREVRIAQRIQSALPHDVRLAIVEAVELRESGISRESALTQELGTFGADDADAVVQLIEQTLTVGNLEDSAAERAFVGFRWLVEHNHAERVGQFLSQFPGLPETFGKWIRWMLLRPDFDPADKVNATILEQIRSNVPLDAVMMIDKVLQGVERHPGLASGIMDPQSPEYQEELAAVTAHAFAPVSRFIVETLDRGSISQPDARAAFAAFALLSQKSQTDVLAGTVQRLEELQRLSPWLEKLVRAADLDLRQAANAAVFQQVLAERLPTLALSHVTELLQADRRKPNIHEEDAFLARRIVEAQPPGVEAAMRLELSLHANGDLTARFAPLSGLEIEPVVGNFDEWLQSYRSRVAEGRERPSDLLLALHSQPGRQLTADLAALDQFGIFDAVIDQAVAKDEMPSQASLQVLIPHRADAANVSTVRRLVGEAPTKLQAQIAFEIQAVIPSDTRSRLLADEGLRSRMTEAMTGAVRDVSGVKGRLAASYFTRHAVIEADNLADYFTQGQGIFMDVQPPEENAEAGAPNTLEITWHRREGMVEIVGNELTMSGSKGFFDDAVMHTGPGRLEGLVLRYKYAERRTPDQPSSVSADLLDLQDMTITMPDGVYSIRHLRITGAAVSADLKTGRPFIQITGARMDGLIDLFFVFYDALLAIIDIITESIRPDGVVEGAEALATSIATRFQNRIAVTANASSALFEGLVCPGIGSIDRVMIGDETDSTVNAVALSLMSNVDWDRLSELRDRWSRGKILSDDEQTELMRLERQVLSVALDVEVGPFEATGVRTVLSGKNAEENVKVAVDVISRERSRVKAVLDSVKRGAEIPTEGGIPGTSTPLSALAALDDGIYKARLVVLSGIIGQTSIVPDVEQTGAPGATVEGGALNFEGGRLLVLPDGTLQVEVTDSVLQDLLLRARELGIQLNVHDLQVGSSTAQRIGSEFGPLAAPAEGFPAGKEGDWLVIFGGIAVNDVGLTIDDVMKLFPETGEEKTCESPEFLELLDGLSGTLTVEGQLTVPAPGALGGPSTVTPLSFEVIVKNGVARFVGISAPLRRISDFAYETFLCKPSAAPAPPPMVSGPEPPPMPWKEQFQEWAKSGINAIEQGIEKMVEQGLGVTKPSITGHGLQWRMDSVDLTDVATSLEFDWAPGQAMPVDVRLRVVPGPGAPARMEVSFHPFVLDRAVGVVKGTPVLIDKLALTRDIMLTINFAGLKPRRVSLPLEGIEIHELRLLLPVK
jgi:Domain of unknown function (DUF4157)